mmetsp:Transcript_21579/g.36761  ORF Transcript_21579/g.36761 Transcript_21579/m.36761 type:complete len:273 (-) Transcript_21579:47-865(-)
MIEVMSMYRSPMKNWNQTCLQAKAPPRTQNKQLALQGTTPRHRPKKTCPRNPTHRMVSPNPKLHLHPYKLIKDQRTQWESSNTQAFLDGNLEDCIGTLLRTRAKQEQQEQEQEHHHHHHSQKKGVTSSFAGKHAVVRQKKDCGCVGLGVAGMDTSTTEMTGSSNITPIGVTIGGVAPLPTSSAVKKREKNNCVGIVIVERRSEKPKSPSSSSSAAVRLISEKYETEVQQRKRNADPRNFRSTTWKPKAHGQYNKKMVDSRGLPPKRTLADLP